MRRKSRKCPTVRKARGRLSKRRAVACLRRRKAGRPSKADKKLYKKAIKALGGKRRAAKVVAKAKRRAA